MSEKDDLEKTMDFVSDQERDYAQNALNEFNKGNFGASLQNLNKLEGRTNDFKVAHNRALVDYFKSDLKKTELFQKSLNIIFNQFSISKDKLDDVDHCVLHFNQAILLYHQRHYTAATLIMERVYKFIEPMDDVLAKQVGLFMIELQLCARQPEKALALITYIENHLTLANTSNVKLLDRVSKVAEQKEKKTNKSVTLDPAAEAFKRKLSKYRARCYIMSHMIERAKKEVQLFDPNNTTTEATFLLAHIEYLQGNYQEAMKILASVPNECLVYNDVGESSTVMFYDNMGVIHHAMGKHNMACHYFQKALKEDIAIASSNQKDNGEKPLYTLGGSKYHELMYNLGISLLHAGRATQAFDCLIIAVRRYHRNSRLWLRLAECCISVHKESNEIDFSMQKRQKEIVTKVIGAKDKQKVILTTNLSQDKKYSNESDSYAVPVASLEFASLCLKNAFILLPTDNLNSPEPLILIPGVTPPAPPPSPGPAATPPLSPDAIIALKNAVLAASAYVGLCLGDYILALEHAQNLLEQPRISGIHRLLGHLYAAEALVLLDKVGEALEHLNPENVKDISFDLPPEENCNSEEDLIKAKPPAKWFPTTLASCHIVMQYNMAAAKAIRGQLDQAAALLKQIWQTRNSSCKVPAHVIMLVLYIELQLGHIDIARSLIKQYSLHHVF